MKLGKKIASIILVIIVCCVSFSGCEIMSCNQRRDWERAYSYFTKEGAGKYHRVKARMIMTNHDYHISEDYFGLDLDEEEYRSHFDEDENYCENNIVHFQYGGFALREANYNILKEAGFFDLNLSETDVYYITNVAESFWNNWKYPVVGVQVGDKVYLDEETGKTNWLKHIREQIEKYSRHIIFPF